MLSCSYRPWQRMVKTGLVVQKRGGSWGPQFRFIAAPKCGNQTLIVDGTSGEPRCAEHMPLVLAAEKAAKLAALAAREVGGMPAPVPVPTSKSNKLGIGGSSRYRYLA